MQSAAQPLNSRKKVKPYIQDVTEVIALELRCYQSKGIEKARLGWLTGAVSQLIKAPPGAGKTHTALHIIRSSVAKGRRAFYIVDDLRLLEQVLSRLQKVGTSVGVIQSGHPLTDISKPIQVCMIQTLAGRWADIYADPAARPDLIVADEAHTLYAAHKRIIADCRKSGKIAYLGLSATPYTKGLGRYFDRVITLATTHELIQSGNLVPTRFKAPFIPDLSNIPTIGGRPDSNWIESELTKVMGDKRVVDDAVAHWLENGENRKTLGFAINIAEAQAYAMAFARAGVNVDSIDSNCSAAEARLKLQAFELGHIDMLWSVGMLIKGFDDPSIACIIDCAPTKSRARHEQKVGRGARPAPWLGKTDLYYFDHAGNVLRHGLPTDSKIMILDGSDDTPRSNQQSTHDLIVCKKCFSIGQSKRCQRCRGQRTDDLHPEHAEGALSWMEKDPFGKSEKFSEKFNQEDLSQIYSEILGFTLRVGLERDWASKMFKKKTGRPPTKEFSTVLAVEPTPQLNSWLKLERIKQAKCHQ